MKGATGGDVGLPTVQVSCHYGELQRNSYVRVGRGDDGHNSTLLESILSIYASIVAALVSYMGASEAMVDAGSVGSNVLSPS